MKPKYFLLSIVIFGMILLNGCTDLFTGRGSLSGISGTVYFGGEPYSALPGAGALSLSRVPSKNSALSTGKQTPPSSLVVRCNSSLEESEQRKALQNIDFEIIYKLKHIPDTYVIRPYQTNMDTAYLRAKNADFIESVEYNYQLIKMSTTPNDPYYVRQWDLRVTKFNMAWDSSSVGSNTVTVAVLDTGINVDSVEFQNRLAPPGDWYDFVDDDDNPREPTVFTDINYQYSHGTNVAGIIGAAPNNTTGYAGAVWDKIKILPIRVLDANDSGTIAAITDGIYRAVDHNANVINLSLGGPPYMRSSLLDNAVGYANSKNVTIVCAAGNSDYGPAIQYPALLAATYPNVIAVGATNYDNTQAYYSSSGPELTVMAPGGDYNSTERSIWNITFDKIHQQEVYNTAFAGTSQAAPHVSALAALLYINGVTSPAKVKEIISQTATDLGSPERDDQYGYGLINAFAALVRVTKANDLTSVTIGLRNPQTGQDVVPPIHPSANGFYQLANIRGGSFELYGRYILDNGYKYERVIPVTISGSITNDLVLQLVPNM